MVQLSHPYITTGKTIALTRWTFVGKVMSLLFNMRSRFVIAFLPRSKHLLILWMQSPFTVILEPKKIKSVTVSTLVIVNYYLQQVFVFYSGHKFLKIKLIRTFENIYPLHYSLLNNKGPIFHECLIKSSFYYFNFVFLQSVSYFSVSLQ